MKAAIDAQAEEMKILMAKSLNEISEDLVGITEPLSGINRWENALINYLCVSRVKENLMRRKESLYAVIGGIAGALLTMAMGLIAPLGAQNENATFDNITCSSLIVDNEDKKVFISDGEIWAQNDEALIMIHEDQIRVYNDGKMVGLEIGEQGGKIVVEGQTSGRQRKDGTFEMTSHDGKKVEIGIGNHGGYVIARGKRGAAQIGIGEYGGDISMVGDNDNEPIIWMRTNENGGNIALYGNDGKQRVGMGVNEYGNGAVSTWDKNGYRLGTLK